MADGWLDPALPSLGRFLDDDAVRREAVAAGVLAPAVQVLARRTMAWEPGRRCTATFALDGGSAPAARTADVLVAEVGHDQQLRFSYASEDRALPGLALVLRGGARIVSYKPGMSCVVDLADRRFAKVVPPGRLVGLQTTFGELGRMARDDDESPRVPVVLDTDLEHGVLVMEQIVGSELRRIADTAPQKAIQSSEQLGRSLAAMNRCRGLQLPTHRVRDDGREVHRCLPAVRAASPRIADRMETLLQLALSKVVAHQPASVGPAHGALRTDQVLVAGGRTVLIDLDGACSAPAGRDLANLSAYLWWRSVRRPAEAATLVGMATAALRGWQTASGAAELDDRHSSAWRSLSLLKIAGRRYRALAWSEWPLVPRLLDEAAIGL